MKRSYLNETIKLIDEVKNVCALPIGYENQELLEDLRDHIEDIVLSIYNDAMEDHEHEVVWNDGCRSRRIKMTEEQESALRNVTPQMIYDYLRNNSIGKIDCRKNRYVPNFEVGGISVSIQISYCLDCYRDKTGTEKGQPISEDEFYAIFGNCPDGGFVDAKYFIDNGTEMSNAIQETPWAIANTLNNLGSKDKIQID